MMGRGSKSVCNCFRGRVPSVPTECALRGLPLSAIAAANTAAGTSDSSGCPALLSSGQSGGYLFMRLKFVHDRDAEQQCALGELSDRASPSGRLD